MEEEVISITYSDQNLHEIPVENDAPSESIRDLTVDVKRKTLVTQPGAWMPELKLCTQIALFYIQFKRISKLSKLHTKDLMKIKTDRENCARSDQQTKLINYTERCFNVCDKLKNYTAALQFLMEQGTNYHYIDKNEAKQFLQCIVIPYKTKHDLDIQWQGFQTMIDAREISISSRNSEMHKSLELLKKLASSFSSCVYAQNIRLFSYNLGGFLSAVITQKLTESRIRDLYVKCVSFLKTLPFLPGMTGAKDESDLHFIRHAARMSYLLSRSMALMMQEYDKDCTLEKTQDLFPLLHMANISLDFPFIPQCRKRNLCSMKDICDASQCIEFVEMRMPDFSSTGIKEWPRLMCRLLISKASLEYRKSIITYNAVKEDMAPVEQDTHVITSRNNEEHVQIINYKGIKKSIDFLKDALRNLGSSKCEDKAIATEFLSHVKAIERTWDSKIPCQCTNAIAERDG